MYPISGFDIRLVFTLPPRDSTLQYKRCVCLWNNFPCIIILIQTAIAIWMFIKNRSTSKYYSRLIIAWNVQFLAQKKTQFRIFWITRSKLERSNYLDFISYLSLEIGTNLYLMLTGSESKGPIACVFWFQVSSQWWPVELKRASLNKELLLSGPKIV